MKVFQAKNDNIVESLIHTIEQDTKKDVFTVRILGEDDEGLETLIVFKDESILMGKVSVTFIEGKMAIRIQGNFI